MEYHILSVLRIAKDLEPVAGSEYARGICELVGKLLLDLCNIGNGTGENADVIASLICTKKAATNA